MSKILIVEDEPIIRMSLRKLLERHEYEVNEAGSVKEAQKHNFDHFDLIISDLRLPGDPGTTLIDAAPNTPVLIMTSYASLRSAVDSMRQGAVDYIAKPFDHEEMVATVARILAEQAKDDTLPASESGEAEKSDKGMIGQSEAMKSLYHRIEQVAPTAATVLIHGETGTGKELTAKAIHNASTRKEKPLISINCAAIPENLIESELFGHEKGAFTGADSQREGLVVAADGGSLFLDEIGELPLEAQARLLRVLQEGEVRPVGSVQTRKVDVRMIAATHRDLGQLSKQGEFREDLYFRLNVIQLRLPPLRERGEDILTLARALIARYAGEHDKEAAELKTDAQLAINRYDWPGNVRELENAIQRAIILCEPGMGISAELLGLEGADNGGSGAVLAVAGDNVIPMSGKGVSLEEYFRSFVLKHQGAMNETELAKQLGVSRKCLWERRQKFGIPRPKK